ncbi:MAG: hypothetical protein PHS04_19015 [Tissierellia bacterium]|nr:hypothetical protein [Tissierellia bacterium]
MSGCRPEPVKLQGDAGDMAKEELKRFAQKWGISTLINIEEVDAVHS